MGGVGQLSWLPFFPFELCLKGLKHNLEGPVDSGSQMMHWFLLLLRHPLPVVILSKPGGKSKGP